MRRTDTATLDYCDVCQARILMAALDGGRLIALDRRELDDPPPGLYVAVDSTGHARPLRWPSEDRHAGESLHVLHDLTHDR